LQAEGQIWPSAKNFADRRMILENIASKLLELSECLKTQSDRIKDSQFSTPLDNLLKTASEIGSAWSGSWLGYHSRVYYANFESPLPKAYFSHEWGLMNMNAPYLTSRSSGDWREYRADEVIAQVYSKTATTGLEKEKQEANAARTLFEELHSQVLSLFHIALDRFPKDELLKQKIKDISEVTAPGVNFFVTAMRPKNKISTRDQKAIDGGICTPPHLAIEAEVRAIKAPFRACERLSTLARHGAEHIRNTNRFKPADRRTGDKVFIGHGRSDLWKGLKDFLHDRLGLQWDEFNRSPVAGISNVDRLSQMLEEAAFAFLVMTAEDEMADGTQCARQNVIHEVGLFQGRLGFRRAIVLLEDGCEEFSNIEGIGQIRFPKGDIRAAFEDIRRVLEREELIGPA